VSTSPESITTTFSNDTAVLATDSDPTIASHKLQTNLLAIQNWLKKWRMKAGPKSVHVTFTTRKETCPPVHINNVQLPQELMLGLVYLIPDRWLEISLHVEGSATGQLDQGFPWFSLVPEQMLSWYPNSTLH
jgi:hypothetical protein